LENVPCKMSRRVLRIGGSHACHQDVPAGRDARSAACRVER
jgi:hypothetical protein